MIRKHFCLLPLLLSFSTGAIFAQTKGYNISISINGWSDTTAFLGYYYGESTRVRDTARVNSRGEFTFDGNDLLPQGIYFLAIGKPRVTRVFEMVVGHTQEFSLTTDASEYIINMKVSGDIDNKVFFENMSFNAERHREAEPILQILQDSTATKERKATAAGQFAAINQKVLAFQQGLINRYPQTLTARILKAGQPIQVPDPPKRADGSVDSTFQLRWYRQHYFDNFNLADDALLRMPRPLYRDKMNDYLDKLWAPQADTLIQALDNIIFRAKANKETYKYAVLQSVLKFQNNEIMGLDEVFVHINDKYFASGEMDFWANAPMKKNMADHADRLRKSLIGQKGANLIMQDVNLKPRSLYDIKNKYTVLYIFDPDCGACKKETPKLVDFYNRKRFDVQVFAVSADTSLVKMQDYIDAMGMKWITVNGPRTYVGPYQDLYDASTTPTLYVMDKDKRIIAKKIPAEKLEEFLVQYEMIESRRRTQKF